MTIEPFEWEDEDGRKYKVPYSALACHHGGIFFSYEANGIPTHLIADFIEWLQSVQAEIARRKKEQMILALRAAAQESSVGYPADWNYNPSGDLGPFMLRASRGTHRDGTVLDPGQLERSMDSLDT